MTDPRYKPQYWVTYQQGQTGGYGQIVGATFDGQAWVYSVAGPSLNTAYTGVKEAEIIALYENSSWMAPRQNGGGNAGGSAYTDTSPQI